MVPGVEGSSPFTHPTLRRKGRSFCSGLRLSSLWIQGCSQVARQGTLTPSFAGSNPAIPASRRRRPFLFSPHDPVAQPVEQLPFKPWVRGSSPRWVTTSEQAVNRLLRFFSNIGARSLRSFSSPNRTRFTGLRFDFGRRLEKRYVTVFCLF